MAYIYSDPRREHEPHALPDVEVFYISQREAGDTGVWSDFPPGWYWWACFPGCMPDGEPNGPFADMDDAVRDAQGLPADPDEDRCYLCGEAQTDLGTLQDGRTICLDCYERNVPDAHIEPEGWWDAYPPSDDETDALADAAERQSEEQRGQLKLW